MGALDYEQEVDRCQQCRTEFQIRDNSSKTGPQRARNGLFDQIHWTRGAFDVRQIVLNYRTKYYFIDIARRPVLFLPEIF